MLAGPPWPSLKLGRKEKKNLKIGDVIARHALLRRAELSIRGLLPAGGVIFMEDCRREWATEKRGSETRGGADKNVGSMGDYV